METSQERFQRIAAEVIEELANPSLPQGPLIAERLMPNHPFYVALRLRRAQLAAVQSEQVTPKPVVSPGTEHSSSDPAT
jgi:hypothetical protein